jgi:hypothetical protein
MYLHTPIKKIHDYLFNFAGKVQKCIRRTSLDELRTIIGLLIYEGVLESSHKNIESLYKMDGTGRLVFPAVEMLDQMCARYTVQPATRRWTMAVFYGMVNIAAVNALAIKANKMRKDQPNRKIKRKYLLFRIAHDLVTQFVTQQYTLSTLPRNIKTATVVCGLVSDSEENVMQDPDDYGVISRKRRRCDVCSRSRDVKTQFVCKGCEHYICKDYMSMITCDTCKNKDETDGSDKLCSFPNSSSSPPNHFIIFTFLNTEMNIEHNRNSHTV